MGKTTKINNGIEEDIKRMSGKLYNHTIARILGISESTVLRYQQKHKLECKGRITERDKAFIRNNFHRMTYDEMGKELGFSKMTIYNWARKMGLRNKWSKKSLH